MAQYEIKKAGGEAEEEALPGKSYERTTCKNDVKF
jgi:hypothetical protein